MLFLVSETTKWKAQTVYDLLASDERFEPFVAASLGDADWSLSVEQKLAKVRNTIRFFRDCGMECVSAVDDETADTLLLAVFSPDLVFYQQPWYLPMNQVPRIVSEYALTFYVPYFVPTFANNTMHCQLQLHKDVYRHFVLNEAWRDFYLSTIDGREYAGSLVATGHPMLDAIAAAGAGSGEDGLVIYAPHWSLNHPRNSNELNLPTFPETGRLILDYALAHPEIKWAFKPHPTLRTALKRTGIMSDAEIDGYYAAWERIGRVSYFGEYVSLFRASRALVTDCDSFLSEYACTRKPVIHLIPAVKNNRHFSPLKPIFDSYYKVHDERELAATFDAVLLRGEDPNRATRIAALEASGLADSHAAGNICRHLLSLLGGSDR